MLLPYLVVAGVIARWQMEQPLGELYCFWLVDVIAMWQMLLPLGGFILTLVLCCSTEPHPIYEAGCICLYFCLGMDCSP